MTKETRQPLTRPDGTDPEGFSRRVAQAYREAVRASPHTPAKAMADEAGVPVTTVHRWVRDARRLGLLTPTRKGSTGAETVADRIARDLGVPVDLLREAVARHSNRSL